MILDSLRRQLLARAKDWAKKSGHALPDNLPMSPAPAHVKDADLALPWAMALAKAAKRPPLELAKELAEAFTGIPEVESAAAVPPGFVNIKLKASALAANAKAVTLDPQSYGREADPAPAKVLVEFVSANPTGPLH